ncbi:MAG TPA: AarF/UbiB family protein [Acidimicrobiales bacterium]|nr:AarF/UbiB family protein [Acidimicrobiales bacterium]
MALSLRPQHAAQYTKIARLLLKHGRRDLVERAGGDAAVDIRDEGAGVDVDEERAEAEALASELEQMGPTFIKLGQLLSTRADLLPQAYLKALSRLQDKVEAIPFEDVRRIVEDELGARVSKAFDWFDETPLAAASLGQVHRARLRSGRDVAVKVQRPNIRTRIIDDLDALVELASVVDKKTDVGRRYGFEAMVEEFRRTMLAELDYRREAQNLRTLGSALDEFERIVVPQPVDDYTTDRVLTMDFVAGRNLTSMGPMARMELDGRPLGEELFRAYVKQILVDGFFHADPHPGNVLVTDHDPPRLALIDLGMVARLPNDLREHLVKLLLAVSEGRGEDAASYAEGMSDKLDDYDRASYTRSVARLVSEHATATVGQIAAGRVVAEMSRIAAENGLRPPPELTMLGKALLNLDEIARTLAPDFDPNEALREEAAELLRHNLTGLVSPANMLSTALEAKEFAEKLPSRVNSVLDTLANGEVKLDIKGIDEQQFMTAFQKVANRITSGLVIAALIIGAAMLMRVETEAELFGYPALAIVCFFAAAGSGVALLVSIVRSDRRSSRP